MRERTWYWTLRGLFFMAVAALFWALFWPFPATSQGIDGTPAKIFIGDSKGIDRGHGSAIYIGTDADGWNRWLTAKHVAQENMTSLRTKRVAAFGPKVEWLCPACDVAIVKTRPQKFVKLTPAPISCRPFRLGEEVHYTGAPATSSHLPRITIWGRVASEETAERPDGSRVYVVDITVNRGASGSGVLDAVGRVIGIVSGADFSGGSPFSPGVHTGFSYIAPLDPEFCKYERRRTKGSSVGGV